MFYHEHPFSRSYGVILPSSLTRVLSLTLVFSTRLPVSVCGTGSVILPRSFSRQCDVSDFSTLFRSASQLVLIEKSISLFSRLTACTHISISAHLVASCVPPPVITHYNWYRNLNLLSIDYASQPRLRSRLTLGGRAFPRKP